MLTESLMHSPSHALFCPTHSSLIPSVPLAPVPSRFHSLHHTSLTYNFSLHLPIYDYLGGTVDPATDITYEKTSQCEFRGREGALLQPVCWWSTSGGYFLTARRIPADLWRGKRDPCSCPLFQHMSLRSCTALPVLSICLSVVCSHPSLPLSPPLSPSVRPESVDLVFLAHGLFVHSIMHIPAIWPSYSKNSMEVTWYTLPFLPLFTVFYMVGTVIFDVFTAYRFFLRGLNLHTRIVPALGLNVSGPWEGAVAQLKAP